MNDQPVESDQPLGSDQPIEVYADYVCPFCYIGKEAAERYRDDREDPPDLAWRFFDLQGYKRGPDGEIDHDVEDGKDEAYFDRVRENVDRLADRYDLDLDLDAVPRVDSWDANVLTLWAEREHDAETAGALRDALYEAYWVDHRDIGDPDVLVDVAESVGLDGAAARDALGDPVLEGILEDRFRDGRQRGVRAVPTFVYGEHAAQGAIPPAQIGLLVGED